MLEAWRKALDERKSGVALLTNLSKTFDCLSHELLVAKLAACGFDIISLHFICNYLRKIENKEHGLTVNIALGYT